MNPHQMNPDAKPVHTCHARGCGLAIEPKFLMCAAHWRMVPRSVQQRIWQHFSPGQEIGKNPSPEDLAVMQEAIDIVAKKEATPKARAAGRIYDYDYPD